MEHQIGDLVALDSKQEQVWGIITSRKRLRGQNRFLYSVHWLQCGEIGGYAGDELKKLA